MIGYNIGSVRTVASCMVSIKVSIAYHFCTIFRFLNTVNNSFIRSFLVPVSAETKIFPQSISTMMSICFSTYILRTSIVTTLYTYYCRIVRERFVHSFGGGRVFMCYCPHDFHVIAHLIEGTHTQIAIIRRLETGIHIQR